MKTNTISGFNMTLNTGYAEEKKKGKLFTDKCRKDKYRGEIQRERNYITATWETSSLMEFDSKQIYKCVCNMFKRRGQRNRFFFVLFFFS